MPLGESLGAKSTVLRAFNVKAVYDIFEGGWVRTVFSECEGDESTYWAASNVQKSLKLAAMIVTSD